MVFHERCGAISEVEYCEKLSNGWKAIGYKISKKNLKKKTLRQEITKVALLYFNQALQQELEMLQNLKLFSLLSSYESYADREENEL